MHLAAMYYVSWTNFIKGRRSLKQKTFDDFEKAKEFARKVGPDHELVIYNHDSAVVYGQP